MLVLTHTHTHTLMQALTLQMDKLNYADHYTVGQPSIKIIPLSDDVTATHFSL